MERKQRDIFSKAKYLKGTHVWIYEDATKEVQSDRKRLVTYLNQAKEQGLYAQLKSNQLVLKGKIEYMT